VFDNTWQALLRPGDDNGLFAPPLPAFAADRADFHRGNALWLAELSRWVYRDVDRAGPLVPTRLREVAFVDRGGTQVAIVEPVDGSPFTALVFRGTDQLRDWLANVQALPRRWPRGGHVHRGFLRSLLRVWRPLRMHLAGRAAPLFVTGHSLGGALATLAGSALRARAVYTFGSPRVGDAAFAATLQAPLFRVENRRDVVTRVPPAGPPWHFVHAGTTCWIGDDGQLQLGGEASVDGADVPAGDRRWFDPAPFLSDHAPANYVAALRRLT
jgi:hypothetical protein